MGTYVVRAVRTGDVWDLAPEYDDKSLPVWVE